MSINGSATMLFASSSPPEKKDLMPLLPHLGTLKKIYPLDFLFLAAPEWASEHKLIDAHETFFYRSLKETLLEDYRFKIVFNFTDYKPIRRHYLSLSAFEVLTIDNLQKLAEPHLAPGQKRPLGSFYRALCRPGSLWKKDQ